VNFSAELLIFRKCRDTTNSFQEKKGREVWQLNTFGNGKIASIGKLGRKRHKKNPI
jgi:hypothetical protein